MSENEHYNGLKHKMQLTSPEQKYLMRLLFHRVLTSLAAGLAILGVFIYIAVNESLEIPVIVYLVVFILISTGVLLLTAFNLLYDCIYRHKTVEVHQVVKNQSAAFKQMNTPVAERCTQKQSFGSGMQNGTNPYDVRAGGERITLSAEQFAQVNNGDRIKIHRSAKSGVVLGIEPKIRKKK